MTSIPLRGTQAALLAILLAVSGCTESNEGYRTYNESDGAPTSPAAPVAEVTSTAKVAPAEVAPAASSTVEPAPQAAPTEAVTKVETPSPVATPAPVVMPPAPPVAEAIQQVSASIPIRKIELLVPEKSFKVVGPEDAVRVSFDDLDLLKVLNADPVPLNIEEYMPKWLLALTGTRVRIRGFMYPPNSETELPGFMMVRDSKDCCFGRNVLIYDKIGVRMREGVTTDYIQLRPFDVVGVMSVKARISDGKLVFLYMINDAVVIGG
jgi:hypothetical protein